MQTIALESHSEKWKPRREASLRAQHVQPHRAVAEKVLKTHGSVHHLVSDGGGGSGHIHSEKVLLK